MQPSKVLRKMPKFVGTERLKELHVKATNMKRELDRCFSRFENFFKLNEIGEKGSPRGVDGERLLPIQMVVPSTG